MTTLGRTGLTVGRVGLGSSYGLGAAGVERAFDQGVNYFYWGTLRREAFGRGLRNLGSRRDRFVLVVQSYSRLATLVGWSLERALGRLGLEYVDVLLFGLWNRAVPERILDAGRRLRQRGLVRHLAVSTHHRPLAPKMAANPDFGVLHVRYNAVHTKAEQEIFPHLPTQNAPGIVAFTATRWGHLLDPRRTPAGERTPTATDCYRFVLAHPAVDVCLSGPADEKQLDQALETLRREPMTEEELVWMRRVGAAIYGK